MPSCDFNNNDCEGCNGCRTDEEKEKLKEKFLNSYKYEDIRKQNKNYTISWGKDDEDDEDDDVCDDCDGCDDVRYCNLHGHIQNCDCDDEQEKEIFFEFKLKIPKAENLDKIKNICLEIENKKNELNDLIKEYKKLLKKL